MFYLGRLIESMAKFVDSRQFASRTPAYNNVTGCQRSIYSRRCASKFPRTVIIAG